MENQIFVIDNSSAWRMDENIPLVVPEINARQLTKDSFLIANPNCSTIQMVVALNRIHHEYGIKRLVISTYQSFTGTGVQAVNQYEREKSGSSMNGEGAYPHPIFENCLPHCDIFFDNGFELCVENDWHSYPVGRNYPDSVKPQCYHEAAGVVGTENGLYFGYLFGSAQFSNHDNKGANIYFCVRKKQNHEQRIPSNWD